MNGQPTQKPPNPDGSVDFQFTDFSAAKHALDELPPGLERLQQVKPGYWEERRRRLVPSDRALTGATIDWLLQMPAEKRPRHLCDEFPRVANRIAACWADRAQCGLLFDQLLVDHRGGRRGFSQLVRVELFSLREQLQKNA